MDTTTIVKNSRNEILINTLTGAILLISGIIMNRLGIYQINNKAVIGLSFIPFAMVFSKWVNVFFIKKYPKELNAAIVSQNDERLVMERNEAEAEANRIIRWLLNLVFLGYTLAVPQDVFNAVGWWIVFALFFIAYILPLALQHKISVKNNSISG